MIRRARRSAGGGWWQDGAHGRIRAGREGRGGGALVADEELLGVGGRGHGRCLRRRDADGQRLCVRAARGLRHHQGIGLGRLGHVVGIGLVHEALEVLAAVITGKDGRAQLRRRQRRRRGKACDEMPLDDVAVCLEREGGLL